MVNYNQENVNTIDKFLNEENLFIRLIKLKRTINNLIYQPDSFKDLALIVQLKSEIEEIESIINQVDNSNKNHSLKFEDLKVGVPCWNRIEKWWYVPTECSKNKIYGMFFKTDGSCYTHIIYKETFMEDEYFDKEIND